MRVAPAPKLRGAEIDRGIHDALVDREAGPRLGGTNGMGSGVVIMPIELDGLRKSFGTTMALDGLDLVAHTESVLAILGPNGAGRTTAVRILATLLKPDAAAGDASIAQCARELLTGHLLEPLDALSVIRS